MAAPKSMPPSFRQLQRATNIAKWRAMDWSKQDGDLAVEMRLSKERIRQIRMLVGAPKSINHRKVRKHVREFQWCKENLNKLKWLSVPEVRQKYGLRIAQSTSLYLFLRRHLRGSKYPWHLVNFDLPSAVLDRIWRLPHNLAASNRSRNKRQNPRWAFMGRQPKLKSRAQHQAYQRAVKAEERKAAVYYSGASYPKKFTPHEPAK